MASGLEFACVYLALILHDDEVTVMEDKINAPIKAASLVPELTKEAYVVMNELKTNVTNHRERGPACPSQQASGLAVQKFYGRTSSMPHDIPGSDRE
ncbi:hypothetical protein HPG69_012854 [Diceros bicornis minor]|uniref:Uncharacterized protein n=1 Tax=Diceros bicornis minor TaxID=77932 RepID=A0A7J7F107_DICBM|nr:hypothetical protein HPG69_012854 [Diceros bicornis minor]